MDILRKARYVLLASPEVTRISYFLCIRPKLDARLLSE